MDTDGFIERLNAEQERGTLSDTTVEKYARNIRLFDAWGDYAPDEEPDASDLRDYAEYLAYDKGVTNQSIRTRMAPIQRYARYRGINTDDWRREWDRIRMDYKPAPQDTPTFLTREQVESMKEAAYPEPEKALDRLDGITASDLTPQEQAMLEDAAPGDSRDYAVICLLAATGIRIGELCALTLDDIDLDADDEPGYIEVERQKRREQAIDRLPLSAEAAQALREYLPTRDQYLSPSGPSALSSEPAADATPPSESEALFVTSEWSTRAAERFGDGWAATPSYLRHRISRVSERAGVSVDAEGQRTVYPHLFRHTAASRLAAAGYSNVQIARWLGVEPDTASIYADVADEQLGEMADAVAE